jgi:ribosomal protein S18 acetylase RimI-like enzyme
MATSPYDVPRGGVPWTIAPIAFGEADEVARVHVRVWQEAYAGLMPAAYLDGLDPEAFAEDWRKRLVAPPPGVHSWLARDRAGVVGFTSSGPARDADAPTDWQLYAITVLARGHGSGVGHALLETALGDRPAYLWVAEGNERAMAFYRKHGFTDDGVLEHLPETGTREIRMSRGSVVG